MKEIFKYQIDNNLIVDNENLCKITHKFYENGEPINVGDQILFALLEIINTKDDISFKLIKLNEKQFHLYETYELIPIALPKVYLKNKLV